MHESNQHEGGPGSDGAIPPQAPNSVSQANQLRPPADRRAGPAPGCSAEPSRLHTVYALALIAFAGLGAAVSWALYPVFVDVYYHMAAVEGFQAAGGLVTHAFWEMAPAGRAHIYPPALHVAGYLLNLLGISARTYVTWLSGVSYAACLCTTWLWLRKVLGARPALFALVLLCGPSAFWWNQAVHTANAAVLVVAPLALLALESEKFLACAVLNFIAISLHPFGLFLPPALVVNALLRRRKVLAGLLAAALPVLLYSPWLAHIWANRMFLTENRTSGDLALSGPGANLGLLMLACAVPGLLALRRQGASALSLIGPALGFAVVLPMGFAGRFFMFNVHWPLACLGGLGLDFLLRRIEARENLKPLAQALGLCVSVVALMVYPSLDLRPEPRARPGGPSPDGGPPPGGRPPPQATRPGLGPPEPGLRRPGSERERRSGWHVTVQTATLPRLFDPGSRPGFGPGPAGPGGPGGMDLIHQRGAEDFFDAVRTTVAVGDVIHVVEPPAASLIAGVTGRWTTSGILRDVRSGERPPPPEQCDYLVMMREMRGPPMPMRPRSARLRFDALPGFEKVFENEFGLLWRNQSRPEHVRQPARATLSWLRLLGLVATGLALVVLDFLRRTRRGTRWLAPIFGTVAVAFCLWPLTQEAARELAHPPTPPARPEQAGPPASDDAIRRQHERVLQAVERWLNEGHDPDAFWSPDTEERLRRLMEQGRVPEAREWLEQALRALERPAARTKTGDTPLSQDEKGD